MMTLLIVLFIGVFALVLVFAVLTVETKEERDAKRLPINLPDDVLARKLAADSVKRHRSMRGAA